MSFIVQSQRLFIIICSAKLREENNNMYCFPNIFGWGMLLGDTLISWKLVFWEAQFGKSCSNSFKTVDLVKDLIYDSQTEILIL